MLTGGSGAVPFETECGAFSTSVHELVASMQPQIDYLNYKLGTAGKMRPFVRGHGWPVLRRRLGGRYALGGPGREVGQLMEA